MYYRKKYEGTILNYSTKKTYRYNNGSGSYQSIDEPSKVVQNAVVDILHDIGYGDAYRDETSGLIFFAKWEATGLYVGYASAMTYLNYAITSTAASLSMSNVNASSGATYHPIDSAKSAYKFYITIIGEPKGYFIICFGASNNPQSTSVAALHVFMGKNIVTNEDVIGIWGTHGITSPSNIYVCPRKKLATTILTVSMAETIQGDESSVILMKKRTNYGIFEFPYVYTGNPKNLIVGQFSFYRFKDGVYWVPSNYYIVKCVTEVSK